MRAQEEARQPFVWVCNTNKGMAKVSMAALHDLGIPRTSSCGSAFPGQGWCNTSAAKAEVAKLQDGCKLVNNDA